MRKLLLGLLLTPIIVWGAGGGPDLGNELCFAALRGETPSCADLLDRGADVNYSGIFGTPILCAAKGGKKEAYDLLLTRGANVTALSKYGEESLLTAAVAGGNLSICESVLALGFTVNSTDRNGKTPLMTAVSYSLKGKDRRGLCEFLLARGAAVDHRDNDGNTALLLALNNNREDVFNLLLERGADVRVVNRDGENLLTVATRMGKKSLCASLLDRGFDVNCTDKSGNTPLMCAAEAGHGEAYDLLLERGADVRVVDEAGNNLLIAAAEGGNKTICGSLLDRGFGVNYRNRIGMIPLMVAAQRGHIDICRLLLNRGADPEAYDCVGETALSHLMQFPPHIRGEALLADLCTLLLAHGAVVDVGIYTSSSKSYAEFLPGMFELLRTHCREETELQKAVRDLKERTLPINGGLNRDVFRDPEENRRRLLGIDDSVESLALIMVRQRHTHPEVWVAPEVKALVRNCPDLGNRLYHACANDSWSRRKHAVMGGCSKHVEVPSVAGAGGGGVRATGGVVRVARHDATNVVAGAGAPDSRNHGALAAALSNDFLWGPICCP